MLIALLDNIFDNKQVPPVVAQYQAAHPEQCWYWTFEAPYRGPCGRCPTCREMGIRRQPIRETIRRIGREP